MSAYNYDAFSPHTYNFQSADGPNVGQHAPDFDLVTLDGQKQRLLDFDGEALVLELGSITCPLFLTRQDTMGQIARDFPQVTSAVLYVREAHPGAAIPAHQTMDDKKACASRLKSDTNDPRTVLVDGIDGQAHKAYGSLPNGVYIIDKSGLVRFKAPWNNAQATRKALMAVLNGQPARVRSYFKPARPSVVFATMRRAGAGSGSDFFKSLPKLVWNNLIKNNLRTLFRA